MSKKILTTPIRSEDLEDIRIGDIIYLNGYLITARDCAHTRLVKHGRKIPVDLAGKAIFHAGPIMVPDQSSGSGFKVVSIDRQRQRRCLRRQCKAPVCRA